MNQLLKDEEMKNWVKACMAQHCFKEGILPFIKLQAVDQFQKNVEHVKQTCNRQDYTCTDCAVNKIKPRHAKLAMCVYPKGSGNCVCKDTLRVECPANGSCGILYDIIKDEHVNFKPNWSNTKSELWSSSSWEQMKCYIQTPGYQTKDDIEDADITALVQICSNNRRLNNIFGDGLSCLSQIREDRNEVCHSGSMKLNIDTLKEYVSNVKKALQLDVFKEVVSAANQTERLDKIIADMDNITIVDEIVSRREVVLALRGIRQEVQEQKTSNMCDINTKIEELKGLEEKHFRIIDERMKTLEEHKNEIDEQIQSLRKESFKTKQLLDAFSDDIHTLKCESTAICFAQSNFQTSMEQRTALVERKLEKHEKSMEQIEKEFQTILPLLERVLPLSDKLEVANGRFTLECRAQTAEQESHVEDLLVEAINSSLQDDTPSEEPFCSLNSLVKNGCDQIKKYGVMKSVKKECIAVYVKFPTLEKWMHFMEKCFNGSLDELFQPVQGYLRAYTKCSEITLRVNISEEDTVKMLNSILQQLNDTLANLELRSLHVEGHGPVTNNQVIEMAMATDTDWQDDDDTMTSKTGNLLQPPTFLTDVKQRSENIEERVPNLTPTQGKEMKSSCPEQIRSFQRKQAHILELAYTYDADYPNVAEKLRMVAQDARSLQMSSSGVFKSVQMASDHMHETMIPIILEAIEDMDEDLIAEAITMTIDIITEVKQKTTDLQTSYNTFSRELEKVKENLKRDKIQIARDNGRLEEEIKEQQKQDEAYKRAMTRLDHDKARMLRQIQSQKEERDQLLDKTEKDGNDLVNSQKGFGNLGSLISGGCLLASAAVAFGPLAPAGAAIALGSQLIAALGMHKATGQTISQMVEQRSKAEESARKDNQELREVDKKKDEYEMASFKNERKIQELHMERGLLDTALECSCELNGHYEFLTLFWTDMIAALGQLNTDIRTGKLLRKLRTDNQIRKLNEICQVATKKWERMSTICGDVEKAIKKDVEDNSAFISRNYDRLTSKEKEDIIAKLSESIRNIQLSIDK